MWNPRIKPSEIIQDEDIFDFSYYWHNFKHTPKCRALINQLICNTNNKCHKFHRKAFRADYISRSTKIGAPSAARIVVLREF